MADWSQKEHRWRQPVCGKKTGIINGFVPGGFLSIWLTTGLHYFNGSYLKKGFWFKVEAAERFKPEKYSSILRI